MKDFLIIGTIDSMTYKVSKEKTLKKEIQFSHSNRYFNAPNGNKVDMSGAAGWITTFQPIGKQEVEYSEMQQEFKTIDHTDIRFLETCNQINENDMGLLAVPIGFLCKDTSKYDMLSIINTPFVEGKARYKRIVIKKK